ncbi:MAG: DUF2207 domain-containing protein, partial [Mogibacterium sp.]|nr:DUF2207 domain-containing protein [Mogibacterium sp.]
MKTNIHNAHASARSFRILLITLLLCLIAILPAHAASNFYVTDYDVRMVVNEDDTYEITETIDVHFTAPSHGIYRSIPYRADLHRDGQHSVYYAKIRDFEMLSGQPWKKQKDIDAYSIRIGDPDRYADTDTTYQFRYVFDNRGDHLNGADEVYYNLIGTDWETQSIDHISFEVVFPKPIDPANVGIRNGEQLLLPFESEDDRIIRGETTENVLGGLTIRAVLPEGYFAAQARASNLLYYLLSAVLAVAAVLGAVVWLRHGRDPEIIETVEFYPPEGLGPADLGCLMNDGTTTGDHVISMLLTLADNGYLKITEFEKETGKLRKKRKTEYRITLLKDYSDCTPEEQTFLNGLFEDGTVTSVLLSDLEDSFYETVNDIKGQIDAKYADRLYDESAGRYASCLRGAGSIGVILLVLLSKLLTGSAFIWGGEWIASILVLLAQIVLPLVGFACVSKYIQTGKKNPLLYLLFLVVVAIGFGLARAFDTFLSGQTVPFLIGLVMCLLLFIMGGLCERRTDYYSQMLGKIRGYKHFLETAEKGRMEALAQRDPGYFYRNLAFAYALGVTKVYTEHFASLATSPPDWYDSPYTGYDTFSTLRVLDAVDTMMDRAGSSMTSSPSSDGGSFSGGGGGGG